MQRAYCILSIGKGQRVALGPRTVWLLTRNDESYGERVCEFPYIAQDFNG